MRFFEVGTKRKESANLQPMMNARVSGLWDAIISGYQLPLANVEPKRFSRAHYLPVFVCSEQLRHVFHYKNRRITLLNNFEERSAIILFLDRFGAFCSRG